VLGGWPPPQLTRGVGGHRLSIILVIAVDVTAADAVVLARILLSVQLAFPHPPLTAAAIALRRPDADGVGRADACQGRLMPGCGCVALTGGSLSPSAPCL
jgi:hypothetical protein